MEWIKLCWPEFEDDLRFHGIVNLRTAALTAEHLKHRGDPGDGVQGSPEGQDLHLAETQENGKLRSVLPLYKARVLRNII